MTFFTIYHWLVLGVMISLLLSAFYFSLRYLRGQTLAVTLIVTTIIVTFVSILSFISLDKVTKKAEIIKFENKRVLRDESIIFTGYIVNTGEFTIGESVLMIRMINHGNGTGSIKQGDFYQPRSMFDRIFSKKMGPSSTRPNAIEKEFLIATDLKAGERRKFHLRFQFPTYFKDVAFRTKLYNH